MHRGGLEAQLNTGQAKAGNATLVGGVCAVSAFGLWALLPIYFNLIGQGVTAWELLLHRVVWAFVVLMGFALMAGRLGRVLAVLRRPGALAALCVSGLAIAGNWGTFLWAVTHGEILRRVPPRRAVHPGRGGHLRLHLGGAGPVHRRYLVPAKPAR